MDRNKILTSLCVCTAAMIASCNRIQWPWAAPTTQPALSTTAPATQPSPITAAQGDAMNAAIAMVAQGRCDQAAAEFARLAGEFEKAGDRPRAAECFFWGAYCAEKQGRSQQAIAQYKQILSQFPETPAARQAQVRLDLLHGQ